MKKIAIIGRPNVGKSTLFNRFVGRRMALVHDKPGMTRDRREATGHLYDLEFLIVDTAGLADPDDSLLTAAMLSQTQIAINQADILLFLIDGRQGCTPYDYELATLLRKTHKPIIPIANKCEGRHGDAGCAEAATLGLGNVIALSAEHGTGLGDLYEALGALISPPEEVETTAMEEDTLSDKIVPIKPLQLAIVGRPNVGKSTLINKLLGEERLLTADIPGVTRDAIALDWTYKDILIKLIDTAGIRRRSRTQEGAEKLSVMDTDRSIQYAEIVVLVLDGTAPFEKQELSLAHRIFEEGRGLVLALNKWDLVTDKNAMLTRIQTHLEKQLAQARGIPCIPICAKTGHNLPKLMEAVLTLNQLWNKRVSTAKLNDWLTFVTQAHPAPMVKGRRIKIKYMTQIKTRPPTFALFASQAAELPESYTRYLVNQLRKDFQMPGIPIRIYVRGSKNPYDKKS